MPKGYEKCILCLVESKASRFARSSAHIPYICENCRCVDCHIVLSSEVCSVRTCGKSHGEPSAEDPRVCKACVSIRERVMSLDEDLILLRLQDQRAEAPL